MRTLDRDKRTAFYRGAISRTMNVLVESQRDAVTGLLKGFTSNYIPILLNGDDSLKEQLVYVSIESMDTNLNVYGCLNLNRSQ